LVSGLRRRDELSRSRLILYIASRSYWPFRIPCAYGCS